MLSTAACAHRRRTTQTANSTGDQRNESRENTRTRTNTRTRAHTHTHARTHTHTCTHIHARTHTGTHRRRNIPMTNSKGDQRNEAQENTRTHTDACARSGLIAPLLPHSHPCPVHHICTSTPRTHPPHAEYFTTEKLQYYREQTSVLPFRHHDHH